MGLRPKTGPKGVPSTCLSNAGHALLSRKGLETFITAARPDFGDRIYFNWNGLPRGKVGSATVFGQLASPEVEDLFPKIW